MILGCLWEVTDRDIDKLTESMLTMPRERTQNVFSRLKESKKKCRMKYLNGSAVAIYGIPHYFFCE